MHPSSSSGHRRGREGRAGADARGPGSLRAGDRPPSSEGTPDRGRHVQGFAWTSPEGDVFYYNLTDAPEDWESAMAHLRHEAFHLV